MKHELFGWAIQSLLRYSVLQDQHNIIVSQILLEIKDLHH